MIIKIITGFCSLLFFMIGADKFLEFLEPPCSLQERISPMIWYALGVMQIAAGILIWFPQFKRYVVGFFGVFMIVFSIVHLMLDTSDIGGSASMAVMLGVLAWDPGFLGGARK